MCTLWLCARRRRLEFVPVENRIPSRTLSARSGDLCSFLPIWDAIS